VFQRNRVPILLFPARWISPGKAVKPAEIRRFESGGTLQPGGADHAEAQAGSWGHGGEEVVAYAGIRVIGGENGAVRRGDGVGTGEGLNRKRQIYVSHVCGIDCFDPNQTLNRPR